MSGHLRYNSLHKKTNEYKHFSKFFGYLPHNSCNAQNDHQPSASSSPWLDSLHRRTLRNHEFFRDAKDSHGKVNFLNQLRKFIL